MRRVRGEDPGAAAGRLLGMPGVRRAVRAEEEARVAAGRGLEQRAAIRLGLQHRQAVVMRPDAAGKQRVAIHQQMLRRDRRRDSGARRRTNSTASRVVTCSNTTRKPGKRVNDGRQHRVDEARLAIKHIDARVGDFAVNLQHMSNSLMRRQHRVESCGCP